MTIDEIDARIAAKEAELLAVQAGLRDLQAQRGAIVDADVVQVLVDSLTPSQRDVVVRVAAMDPRAKLSKVK